MKKNTSIFFYFLSVYAILQFVWWGYHIIDLDNRLYPEPIAHRKMLMIIGEGTVFLVILILGIWKLKKSIGKELEFSKNQNNFLLSITHELKTPIASTKLYLQTLQKHSISEEKRSEILQKTLQQNRQLELLIDNILNASRLENKRLILHKEELNVTSFLTSIFDRYEKQYTQFQFKKSFQKNIIAQIDPFIFETVINNLIENAMKYAGNDGPITIELQQKERITVRIIDQGPGIPLGQRKNIFKKFYRLGNEDTRTQKGSGLGLFIVNQLTHLHMGNVKYYDNKPQGAIFEVTI